jgi:hypothetical protein
MTEVLMTRNKQDYNDIVKAKREYVLQGLKTKIIETIEGYKLVIVSKNKSYKEDKDMYSKGNWQDRDKIQLNTAKTGKF